MSAPISFGLKKANFPKKPTVLPKKSAFSMADDDDAPVPSTSTLPSGSRPKVSTATLSRAQKAKQAVEIELDSSVYEYDEVWDNMKEGGRLAELEKKKDAGERKPKYISRLMETAEVRKRDRVRAEDKMVQREREMEGAEFADKDEFVTPAYLAQQEELRKIEEEEKKKEEANAGKAGGMSSFYKSYLDTTSKAHDLAVAASLTKSTPSSTPSFTIAPAPAPLSEAQLAAEVTATTGRKIEVNDDGVIIDKRELLGGGLNIIAKPKKGGFAAPISARAPAAASTTEATLPPGLSAAERGRQSRERHSREVERQMIELEGKRKREAEELLEQKVQKVAKRNDETKIEEMKRKAEERRLKREEDARIAAANPPPPDE